MGTEMRYWRAVQLADKFVRERRYRCLFPGCKRTAVDCHAIPRSLCTEALATDGHIYTRRHSFNQALRMKGIESPPEIIRTSVNKASTFKGYCALHDARLFAPAEAFDSLKSEGMFVALQLRAYSIEYCRLRSSTDFLQRVLELTQSHQKLAFIVNAEKEQRERFEILQKLYLNSMYKMYFGSRVYSVEYLLIPFARNLEVSCSGCFTQKLGEWDSVIAFNLLCRSTISYLVLSVFKAMRKWLDNFLDEQRGPGMWGRILNDIAFHHCEEPLISSRLWESLSPEQQWNIRLSLRPPVLRGTFQRPEIIKIAQGDIFESVTEEMREQFPRSMFKGR